jgi:hypothetical protein
MDACMADDRSQLQATLDDLRVQLHSSGITRDAAERLQKLIKEAEQVLAGSHAAAGSSASLRERLANAALDFEASHPVLAGTLGSVIDALAQMGI